MPATPLPAWTRYFPPGTRKTYWLTAVANPGAPTRAELNAGTDLTGQIAAVNGFTLLRDSVDITPLGSQSIVLLDTTFNPTGTNEIILYASANSQDVRQTMPVNNPGFLVFLFEGDVGGQYGEVWPANLNTTYMEQNTETPGQMHLLFTIQGMPSQVVLIPA